MAHFAAECEKYVGTQSGGMDQAISIMGQAGVAKLISFNPARHPPAPANWCIYQGLAKPSPTCAVCTAGKPVSSTGVMRPGLRALIFMCCVPNTSPAPSVRDAISCNRPHITK